MKDTNFKFKFCNLPVSPRSVKSGHFARLAEVCKRRTFCTFRRKGFTLLEVMIALAIIGIVFIAVFNTVNYHADVAYDGTITTRMFLLASEKLAELEMETKMDLDLENEKIKTIEGIIPETDFRFQSTVSKTDDKNIIELRTTIISDDKKVTLSKLIINKYGIK